MAIGSKSTAIQARLSPHTSGRRSVTILGSTGSVGSNTVDLIQRQPDDFDVVAITAHVNVAKLVEQCRALKPQLAVIADPTRYMELKNALAGTNIAVAAGEAAVVEAAALPADWVMSAIVGAAGLEPTLAAARRGATVAFASKECLVCAGDLMMHEIRRNGATLLPVDSEHNAIFQVFDFDQPERVDRVILTASGGPFREFSREAMATVTPEQAVAHPNWTMGAKISVDSATMMNKGLELIEAFHLFPVRSEQIEILVHPQSVIHSMVAYVDGSVLAQLGVPDMRTPISYTLGWPKRIPAPAGRLDLAQLGKLTFENPDIARFPALRVAREVLQEGGGAPTIFNAANEVAVRSFLDRKIGFLAIVETVERTLDQLEARPPASIADVIALDSEARRLAGSIAGGAAGRA